MCFNISSAAWNLPLAGIRKIVFLALCDRADKSGKCWPSVEWLVTRCGISERSVRLHIGALAFTGHIRRVERLGRSTVYYINLAKLQDYNTTPPCPDGSNEQCDMSDAEDAAAVVQPPEAPAAPSPAPAAPSPVSPAPIPNQYPINEPINTQGPAVAVPPAVIDISDKQILADFTTIRKAKRKPALTQTEAAAFSAEGEKLGMSLTDVLRVCVLRSWSRFEAAWLPTPQVVHSAVFSAETEPAKPVAKPSTVLEGVNVLAELRHTIMSSVCATGNKSLAWAHNAIAKKQAGEYVAQAVVRNACAALNMDYKSLQT